MVSILPFKKKAAIAPNADAPGNVRGFLDGFSIEVMPRTAAKIPDFRAILPQETRIYVAHIDGTPIDDMLTTAGRLVDEGFTVMPHFPARSIASRDQLNNWISAYRDIGVHEALLLAGGIDTPRGDFESSMDLMETGLFDAHGFTRLHVAGHPEGNRDIDPAGGEQNVMEALAWKQAFSERTDADMAIATQFCFEAGPVIDWARRLEEAGVGLPVHIGIAGPAKLQTMIKFAMACGVGPSIRVLQRRAKDITKLMTPFTPHDVLAELAAHHAATPDWNVTKVHFFPLGGINQTAEFTSEFGFGPGAASASA